ncbi:hypothetical protein [Wolbachia endosymbiont (group A) of Barypeithes pellucidus]|uniref:hypothetical protein n=1 Tax=Wolbachia endosymbiont (group A) of Barypeithes pellucidus TaxID=3139322 RepID=UPI003CCB0F02
MPNVSEINQELVRAFNINLCKNDIVMTNLTVQNLHRNFHKEDHIVISFDKSMGADQCMKYLNDMKEKIVEEFCEDESSASMSFNISFFPFKFSKKQLNKDSKGRYKFSVPIDKDVVFNLKCCLAHVLAKDIKVNIGHEFGIGYAEENTGYVSFDRKSYLYCMRFNDWKLKVRFINLLSSKIARYGNVPMDYLEIIDNRVYIEKSIFDNVEFIKNIVKDKASLICRDFEIPSAEDEVVEGLKFSIIDFIRRVGIPVDSVLRSSYLGNHENSILVPIAKDGNVDRVLTRKEVNNINNIFDINILRDIEGCTSPQHLPVFGRRGIYGIDFANQEISYCVLNKIMENSVINKDHELSIDPELRLQALSPAQSPLNSPTHAGPSGLRTPPNQRNRDSGYDSNSPPKPKDSVAPSTSGGPRSSVEQSRAQGFPTRSQDGALEDSPR